MVIIDGSTGEGGGQILRTSLTLSVITGKPLRIVNIRAKRSKPGLRHQHLQAVKAAAAISGAQVEGAELHSQEIRFQPGPVQGGNYYFKIPTAGATGLVLQTIFLPLSMAQKPSRVTISGGTHVNWSPCYHYLAWQWLPYMRKLGFEGDLTLEQAGYFPRGGGRIVASVRPAEAWLPLLVRERGPLRQIRGLSAASNLPGHISKRQRDRVVGRLGSRYPLNDIRLKNLPSHGKGTMMLLLAEFANSQVCYFSLGARGKRAERVADEAVDAVQDFLDTEGVIDEYLADQLLLPLALASGVSEIRIPKITAHLRTNAEIIRAFLPARIIMEDDLLRVEPE